MKLNKLLLSIAVCFTPGQNCTNRIIHEIDNAKTEILIQAYSFTDMDIANAVTRAKKRNVSVSILIDKRNVGNSVYNEFDGHNFILRVDHVPGLAHNKIIIIDRKEVLTGSFNFSKAAQHRNAENLLVIDDKDVVKLYLDNWSKRNEN